MSIFKKLKTEGLEESQERVGGLSRIFDSDIYTGVIKMIYADQAKSGAMNINLIINVDSREYKETIYITNKQGENFFMRDKKKQALPGFIIVNELALITTGKELSELDVEEKVVNVYNYESKKEEPTKVQAITDMIGETISFAVMQIIEDKTTKNGNGEYVPTGETRTINEIKKFFDTESHKTVSEATKEMEATFWDKWLEAHQGKTSNKAKGAKEQPDNVEETSTDTKPKKSLFGKK